MTYRRKETIGPHTMYLGDCKTLLPTLGKVDHVLSDPPYGEADTHAGHLSGVTLRNGEPAGQALGFSGISAAELLGKTRDWSRRPSLIGGSVFSCEWKHHRLR